MKLLRRNQRRAGVNRRSLLQGLAGGAAALVLAGCDAASRSSWFPRVLSVGGKINHAVHRALVPRRAMAQEFTEADLSPSFRSNGTNFPDSEHYRSLASEGFAHWKLEVGGLVATPRSFTLAQLQEMPSRTQITRHDCVEGWSAIAKWKGVPLSTVLAEVQPTQRARYVVFHCADPMEADGKSPYYESVDMEDALHPQTILAYELNDKQLPIPNGAPIRVRIERQLGYKHAKYIMRIELVDSLEHIGDGNGGYWEDQGYEWYGGI